MIEVHRKKYKTTRLEQFHKMRFFIYTALCFSDSYEAEQLLKEVCVHSVTGILKLYLRELPEALFTDLSYEKVCS